MPWSHPPAIKGVKRSPIHADAPPFVDQSTTAEVLETGIKVVDLLAPYARGGKIGLFGGAGVGKTVLVRETQPLESQKEGARPLTWQSP